MIISDTEVIMLCHTSIISVQFLILLQMQDDGEEGGEKAGLG